MSRDSSRSSDANTTVWSGNVGEWGEVFSLMYLLSHNDLYNADSHGHRIENEHGRIRTIYRSEAGNVTMSFKVNGDYIDVSRNGVHVATVEKLVFQSKAHTLFQRMLKQGTTASHPEQEFLKQLGCRSIKAASTTKSDLTADVYDPYLSSITQRQYSIKTVIGGAPSLANASNQSYIDYELSGFDKDKAAIVNNMKDQSWVASRTKAIFDLVDAPPKPVIRSDTFRRNLQKCYFRAPDVVGFAVLYGQLNRGKAIIDSIANLFNANPLGLDENDMEDYEIGIRKYLWGIVFDMNPGRPWRGQSDVDGYLLVTADEEVLAYQVTHQTSFQNYLLLHTKWDTPSTSRYKEIGRVWQRKDGTWMYTLNCAVRYTAKEYKGQHSWVINVND